jgi:hypothetical protein
VNPERLRKAGNRRRLTDLEAMFIMNAEKAPCGIRFACPNCAGNCWIEARWSDKAEPGEALYQRAPVEDLTLQNITIAPGIDNPCGIRIWVHDGEVIWP